MGRNNRNIVSVESEYEHLVKTIHKLQESLVTLSTLRDDLIYRLCPALRAQYEEKVGGLERELLAAQTYLKEEQRIIEILQAQMNARKVPSLNTAQEQARAEFKKYEENLRQKAEEAENFRKYWEKDSGWSQYQEENASDAKQSYQEFRQASQEAEEAAGEKSGCGTGSGSESSGDFSSGGRSEGAFQENLSDKEDGKGSDRAGQIRTIKDLYRKIVKRLHPDIHPNATQHEKDLLNKANDAYKEKDEQTLQAIWDELSGLDMPEEKYEDTEEGRKKLRELMELLRARVKALMEEVRAIQSEFPYTEMEFLNDEGAVSKRQDRLHAEIEKTREAISQLEELIKRFRQYVEQQ